MNKDTLLDILDQAEIEYVSERPNGGGWIPCLCPFAEHLHDSGKDSNPSFFVKVSNDGVSAGHCFTCKTKGRISTIIRKLAYYREVDYDELAIEADLEDIPKGFGDFEGGTEIEERIPIVEDAYLSMYPLAWEHPEARGYLLKERIKQAGGYGIPIGEEAADVMGLRFDPLQHRVLFPVRGADGQLYGYSGRTVLPKKYITGRHPRIRDYEFDKHLSILGEHLVQPDLPTLVVEGLFAYATMVELGVRDFCNPVAIMGSSLSEAQRELLIDIDEPTYLLFDPDEAGRIGLKGKPEKGMDGALAMLRDHVPTYECLYPEDVTDPDDLTYDEVAEMIEEQHERA